MSSATHNAESIFWAALNIPSQPERVKYLDQACGGDQALRAEVDALLADHPKVERFLERPAAADAIGETAGSATAGQRVGAMIGPYKLLQKLGEGGMGIVWVAEQERPVKRRVALKVIKAGMDSAQVIARFEAERQALALMDHSNIAKVLDAGTTEGGRPYFVMELVKGVPITKYCDELNLPNRERLNLFVAICQAVQHAHQKGIIHRDLKPTNILVAMQDGEPVPKVIDFGVAKALTQPLTERTLMTEFGAVIGTLEYMSPEQAELSALDIDTRADIYGLGALLYELLTGTTPLDRQRLRSAAYDEMLRMIREEEPPKPSTRLTTSHDLPSLASHRRTEPRKLGAEVRGELDWIVMKALEKDRRRRYETANGLARDIERFLHDEPVEACPPSLRYRLSKVLRRNRGPAIAAGLLVLALTAGIVGTTAGLVRANAERRRALTAEAAAIEQARQAKQAAAAEARQRQRADAEAAAARAVRNFLQDDLLRQASIMQQVQMAPLTAAGTQFKENPTIRELLDRAAAEVAPGKIEQKFPNLPLVQAEVLKAIGDAYGDVEPSKAIEPLQRAIELYRKARGQDDPATLAARHSLGMAYLQSRKSAEAIQILEAVHRDRERVLGPTHPDTFTTREFLGMCLLYSQGPSAAIPYFQRLEEDARRAFGDDDLHHAFATLFLGSALTRAGRPLEAFPLFEATRAAVDRLKIPTDHPYRLLCEHQMALAYYDAKQFAKAIPLFEKFLSLVEGSAGDESMVWQTRHSMGWSYLNVGQREQAIAAFEKNLAIAKPPEGVVTMQALAWALRDKDVDRSLSLYKQARALRAERGIPDDERELRVARQEVGVLRSAGRTDEALALIDEIIPRTEKVLGADHLDVHQARLERARCLAAMKQYERSDALFRDTIARLEKLRGPNDTEVLAGMKSWMLAVRDSGQSLRAAEMAGDLAARRRGVEGSESVLLAEDLFHQGSNLVRAGRPAEGEPALREAVAIYMKKTPQSWTIANAKNWLGIALHKQQKIAEAEPLLLAAFAEMTERIGATPAWGHNHRRDIAERLIALYTAQDKAEQAAKWQKELDVLRATAPSSEG